MPSATFAEPITSETTLREILGTPSEIVRRKQLPRLDEHCRAFIAHAPFVLVSTADAAGNCDVSPRGDAPGFVLVLDDQRLVIPERPGNRRTDTLRNILANPHVGLLFVIPGRGETLRLNGRATLFRDPAILAQMAVGEKVPLIAIGVEVEEAYLHCAKAFLRSHLWEPDRWPDLAGLASAGQMLESQLRMPDKTAAEIDRLLEEGYRTRLY